MKDHEETQTSFQRYFDNSDTKFVISPSCISLLISLCLYGRVGYIWINTYLILHINVFSSTLTDISTISLLSTFCIIAYAFKGLLFLEVWESVAKSNYLLMILLLNLKYSQCNCNCWSDLSSWHFREHCWLLVICITVQVNFVLLFGISPYGIMCSNCFFYYFIFY